jgi:hypothetical protein
MPGTKYDEKDAAKDTSSSEKEVREAHHRAREDAHNSGMLPEREKSKGRPADECNYDHKK